MIDSQYEELRREFSDFGVTALAATDIAERSRRGEFSQDLWRRCGQWRIQGLVIPAEYGGRGLSPLQMVAAMEGLGYGCQDSGLLFAVAAQLFACAVPLWKYGSEDQKQAYLPSLCNGEILASNAMTESQGGSAAFDMSSSATLVDGEYQLSGLKSYCANAPMARLCLAYVATDSSKGFMGGISAFLLDLRRHKFQVTDEVGKFGLRTCLTGQISLDGVSAQYSDLLGKPGAGGVIFNHSMEWERVGMAALQVGTMTRLLEHTVQFARGRRPGGIAITRHQGVSHPLANMQTELSAGRLLVYQAAHSLENKRSAGKEAAMAKLFVSEGFKAMTSQLMQIQASAGYTVDSEIARAVQDAMAATLYSGTSEIQRNIIAGWMGC